MKQEEMILDFTPLLDVIMIILFFFILFSRLDVNNSKEEARKAQEEAARNMEAAASMMADAEECRKAAEEALAVLENSDSVASANSLAIYAFQNGGNLRIYYDAAHAGQLTVRQGETRLQTIPLDKSDRIAEALAAILREQAYQTDSTILCDFICDFHANGSNNAYKKFEKANEKLKKQYPRFYYAVIDISER